MTGRTDRQLGDRAWGSDISSAGLHSRWFRELRDRRFGLQSTCFCDPIRLEGYESSGPGVILVHKWLGGVAGPRPNGRCQITDAAFFEQSGQSRVRFSDILKMRVDSKSSG